MRYTMSYVLYHSSFILLVNNFRNTKNLALVLFSVDYLVAEGINLFFS